MRGWISYTSKRHTESPMQLPDNEWSELKSVLIDSYHRLCEAAGMTYMGSETVGFNQGRGAGQTVAHAHIHVLPTTKEDPRELRYRGGVFEVHLRNCEKIAQNYKNSCIPYKIRVQLILSEANVLTNLWRFGN